MNLAINSIISTSEFQDLTEKITSSDKILNLGLGKSARLPIASAIYKSLNKPILLITQKTDRALTLLDEFSFWQKDIKPQLFPEPTALFYENAPWGENTRRERLDVLTSLAQEFIPGNKANIIPTFIIAPVRAIMARTLPRRVFLKSINTIKINKNNREM